MKVIALNGSPRKGWNTHLMIESALEGAASVGAETELIHLYDLKFTGCISCFQCKKVGGKSIGHCAVKDDLHPVLEAIDRCDALIIGSPIYIGEVTAATRALIERLTFQFITYKTEIPSFHERRIPVGLIYTMNVPETAIETVGYAEKFKAYESLFERIIGPAESVLSTETWQTEDYSKFGITFVNEEERRKRREEVFPQDLQNAFDLGKKIIQVVAAPC